MPDRRSHRGRHPEDTRLFHESTLPTLQAAAADLCWLFDHGYAHDSSLKLVGDRHRLVARQRTAVSRCSCSSAQAARRKEHQIDREKLDEAILWIDGYNVLTTIEAALAGGVILMARDGAFRDMASMHGSYRKVAETIPAIELLGATLAPMGWTECWWWLDRPVSNSGRLKSILEATAAARGWSWQVKLASDPDRLLVEPQANQRTLGARVVVATADSAILDRCEAWFNLAREAIVASIPTAWTLPLSPCKDA